VGLPGCPDRCVVLGEALGGAFGDVWGQFEEQVAAVARVGAAVDPAGALEAVYQHRDRTRGQGEAVAELALGERSVGF